MERFYFKFASVLEARRIIKLVIGFSLLFAFVSFESSDIIQLNGGSLQTPVANWEGIVGANIANWIFFLIGITAFIIPTHLILSSFIELSSTSYMIRSALQVSFIICLSTIFSLTIPLENYPWDYNPGGIIGLFIAWYGLQFFGMLGFSLIIFCCLSCTTILYFDRSLIQFIIGFQNLIKLIIINFLTSSQRLFSPVKSRIKQKKVVKRIKENKESEKNNNNGTYSEIKLLNSQSSDSHSAPSNTQLKSRANEIEGHLIDFGIKVTVVAIRPGPIVTRFELQPEAGMKVSRITSLSKDLARSLSVTSVRIVEVIPGKSVVGLELPNAKREVVKLGEVLNSRSYLNSHSILSVALGKDIAGHPVVVDLTRMPHLLVAGTTGSGKSVGLNTMILSLISKSAPEQLRLIMIDPKMLELAVYDGIPHLLTPVVTDMKDASNALKWCVMEMERRYHLMAKAGVRNIANYNAKLESQKKQMNLLDDVALKPLPYIVVIADEYADLMMVVGKKVEQLIARIAQKARAAGIHLVLATQRPSVDVVTGLIKANIPTRIAFQVSSRIDSRTVLDQGGAEQLLGHGDMLYLPPGTSVPIRVHGAFVEDDEVHKVVKHLKSKQKVEYIDDVTQHHELTQTGQPGGHDDAEKDALYDQAVQIVIESGKTSISYLQRRLRIGYNRSAVLIEQMEKSGILSAPEQNGTRTLLVKNSQA